MMPCFFQVRHLLGQDGLVDKLLAKNGPTWAFLKNHFWDSVVWGKLFWVWEVLYYKLESEAILCLNIFKPLSNFFNAVKLFNLSNIDIFHWKYKEIVLTSPPSKNAGKND